MTDIDAQSRISHIQARTDAGRISRIRLAWWLGGIAVVAAGVHTIVAFGLPAPWIVPDELIYAELAKSIGSGSMPSVRGEPTWGYGLLYPLLISPAWAFFDDPARAYAAAKLINAIVLATTVFPVYFLARRFVGRSASVFVGALSVCVPSMLYAGTLLTEVALYPAFSLALLGLAAALASPTRRNQLFALAGVAFACSAKPLALVLVPVYVLAILHLALLDRMAGQQFRDRIRAHRLTMTALAALGVFVVGASTARGNPDAIFGVYGVVLGNIDLSSAVVWFLRHVAELDLYVAVVPFAATLIVIATSVWRNQDRRLNEFSVLTTWTILGVLGVVAAYSSKPLAGAEGYLPSEARLHERNTFVVVPLLLLGLAVWLERGRPGRRGLIVASAAVASALPFTLPLGRLLTNANFQNLALIPWAGKGMTGVWPWTFVFLAVVAFLVVTGRSRRSMIACWAVVALSFGWTSLAAHFSMDGASDYSVSNGVGRETRWIDSAVPKDADVTALWVSAGALRTGDRVIWMGEFFNRSVGDVVEIGVPMPYALPSRKATIVAGQVRDVDGALIKARYVLAPCWVTIAGKRIASDDRADASVYRIPSGLIRVHGTTPTQASLCRG